MPSKGTELIRKFIKNHKVYHFWDIELIFFNGRSFILERHKTEERTSCSVYNEKMERWENTTENSSRRKAIQITKAKYAKRNDNKG